MVQNKINKLLDQIIIEDIILGVVYGKVAVSDEIDCIEALSNVIKNHS